jgi:sugar/nucleoside kinase (ribokinase family)
MQNGVIVAGHVCLDLTPKFFDAGAQSLSQILRPGALTVVGECVVATGGAVANTGLALVKLGVPCRLMGRVGDDALGGLVKQRLGEFGRADDIRRVPGEQTSYTVVIAPPGIDRAFLHNPGANDSFGADDVDYDAVGQAGIFHFGYPPLMRRLYEDGGEQLAAMFERARRCGATTSLDMALPDPESPAGKADWEAILRAALPYVDLFLPSAEEVLYFLERDRFQELRREAESRRAALLDLLHAEDLARLSARLLSYGAGVVALKAGHMGIYARTAGAERIARFGRTAPGSARNWAGRELWQPPYRAWSVASATGAGDCAVAGLLTAFLRGETIERGLKHAAAAGAQNVTAHDAVSGVRPYEETAGMLESLPSREIRPGGGGWRYDEGRAVWLGPADSTPGA